jgi:hypothetical protein
LREGRREEEGNGVEEYELLRRERGKTSGRMRKN